MRLWLLALCALLLPAPVVASDLVGDRPSPGALRIADRGQMAQVITDPADYDVVHIAADDLRQDLATVTSATPGGDTQIWIGTLGRHAAIDRLVAERRVAIGTLQGAWESFLITSVDRPATGVAHALLIIGSDRRGTAFGTYELSRAIGVSPWSWWADVTPARRPALYAKKGLRRFGPPSVRYRGIFINDEDWGLIPWAAGTHAPGEKPLGPKTYARVFELMLRLKANLLWPGMHKITRPFNADPANAALADRYGIVMGSSHAEPMLRNNVGEWTAPPEDFDYVRNAPGVQRYWAERVASNAALESVWTLGMRGIHDSGMVGPTTMDQRRQVLETIFADQRRILAASGIRGAPQVFSPYKEVLDIYRAGLKVPDDVTLMWPDDNFGYIRHFPDAAERARAGGSGIYYHLSYLGAPLSYLWLSTTPPALIREEMGRAYDLGARRMWVANVGDIKPAELAIDYFLSLAWDLNGTRAMPIDSYVERWAAETIDPALARPIADLLRDHHRLNFARRPEHLQWYLPGEKARKSPFSIAEADSRLAEFARSTAASQRMAEQVPPHRRDAFFELVAYPVESAAAANARYFAAEAHDLLRDVDLAEATRRAGIAVHANATMEALTRRYNNDIAGGKWRGMMAIEPADGQWRTYRLTSPILPARYAPALAASTDAAVVPFIVPAPAITPRQFRIGDDWRLVDGLGRHGALLTANGKPGDARATLSLPTGSWRMLVDILPTYADADGQPLRLTIAVDGQDQRLEVARETGSRDWADAVFDNRIAVPVAASLAGGAHDIVIRSVDRGVMIEAIRFERIAIETPKHALR